MPYIKDVDHVREEVKSGFLSPYNAGELNFKITTVVDQYLVDKGKNYQNINEVIGVLECAKLELYRRIAAPYEDSKCALNGDVYTVL